MHATHEAATGRMRLCIVLDLFMALLSGVMYSFAIDHVLPREKIGLPKFPLCKLVCSAKPMHFKLVPCFVLPVAGCSAQKVTEVVQKYHK